MKLHRAWWYVYSSVNSEFFSYMRWIIIQFNS
jgi:hypothetical protein